MGRIIFFFLLLAGDIVDNPCSSVELTSALHNEAYRCSVRTTVVLTVHVVSPD